MNNNEVSANNGSNKEEKINWGKEIRDWVIAIAIAVIVALLIRNFVFTLVKVQGQSMEPTLQSEDRLYVNRFMYTPEKDDVVIFVPASDPERPYVKRVIATEGDTVYIDFGTGDIYVNDEKIDEP
ncbi:MAG: signal peptidase I, partial [Oscillospiraceae bacterium]